MPPMEYAPEPNLILEALCYLGLRANEAGRQTLEERFCSRGNTDISRFRALYAPFEAMQRELDRLTALPLAEVQALFGDILGDSYQTNGCYSPPMLLLLPMACCHRGDLDSFREKALTRSPDQTARSILISLDMASLLTPDGTGAEAILLERLLSSDLPKSARVRLLNVQKNSRAILERALPLLEKTVGALTQLMPELERLTELLTGEVNAVGCEACLREISTFPAGKAVCHLRPLVVDPSTNLCLDAPAEDGSYTIYCGVMRAPLWHLQLSSQASLDQIYECIRLLGDRTRFDIFCYLQNRPAYGQELSKRFGLARNTIHHHMSQMFKAGLVNCTMEGTRVYYSINEECYSRLLDQQRALLLGGYPAQD